MRKLVLLLSVLVFAACAFSKAPSRQTSAQLAPSGIETDRAAVLDLFRKYQETVANSDADGWLALWTEDGLQMPPGAPALHGKAAITKGSVDSFRDYVAKFGEFTTEEIQIAGDWGYTRGTYTLTATPKAGGEPMHVDGKWLSIVKRQPDGSWKIHRDCFNSNR